MDKWIKSPWFMRTISLLLAILLYTSVTMDENTRSSDSIFPEGTDQVKKVTDIPLEVKMDEEKYVVRGVPEVVNVTLSGPNSILTPAVRQLTFQAYIDLTNLEPGEHTVSVQTSGIANQLAAYVEPDTVTVTLEERASGTYDVELELIGESSLSPDVELGKPTITPSQVEVTGPKTEVDRIAMVKALINVTDATTSIQNQEAPIKVYDYQGNELNVFVQPSNVRVTLPIESPSKSVPFELETTGELPEGLSLATIKSDQVSVTLYGPQNILDKIDQLETIKVDLSTVTDDTVLDLDIPLPPGVRRSDPEKIRVTIEVEETEELVIEDVPIQVKNNNQNRNITFINPENEMVSITVNGTKDQLEGLTSDDFEVSIDVGDYYTGEFETDIIVDGPDDLNFETNIKTARIQME
ncbi:CdaR family protein [Bacillaceae bacterium S4-13-56]